MSMSVEQLQAEIAKLKAEKAALLLGSKPLVEEGIYEANGKKYRTFTVNAPGQRPFTVGEGKCKAMYRDDVKSNIMARMAKPVAFETKTIS